MKKYVIFILISIFVFCLSSCQQESLHTGETSDEKLHVVTTIFPYYDFVRTIGKDHVDVQLLLKPGTESHSYEPSPQDIIAIENCDLFVYNGGESDAWVDQIIDSSNVSNEQICKGMELVSSFLYEEEEGDGMQSPILSSSDHAGHDHAEGTHEIAYDEHIWTSPTLAKELVKALTNRLAALDFDNSDVYHENMENYLLELDQLDQQFQTVVSQGQRKNILFGDRFPFLYFAKTYGLEYSAAFPGCSSESEPSAKTVAYLTDKVREEDIPVVFYIEFSNQKIADTICAESGAEKLLFHSCHNVTAEEMSEGVTYLELMKRNVENLRKALSGS